MHLFSTLKSYLLSSETLLHDSCFSKKPTLTNHQPSLTNHQPSEQPTDLSTQTNTIGQYYKHYYPQRYTSIVERKQADEKRRIGASKGSGSRI